jgi:hypothetical protein
VLDADWTTGKNFERVDSSVCAILIRPGAGGAVRVYSDPIKNDLAGTVMIPVKTGERCRPFGNPSVRFSMSRDSVYWINSLLNCTLNSSVILYESTFKSMDGGGIPWRGHIICKLGQIDWCCCWKETRSSATFSWFEELWRCLRKPISSVVSRFRLRRSECMNSKGSVGVKPDHCSL